MKSCASCAHQPPAWKDGRQKVCFKRALEGETFVGPGEIGACPKWVLPVRAPSATTRRA